MPDAITAAPLTDLGSTWPRFSSIAAITMVVIPDSMHPTVTQFACAIPGHVEAGTVGTLTVEA